ncbi:uncharacterized protein F5147DRAFT_749117 [Suillus discolor]|uniref:Uncharacterized protein n=1 Tax=Suillus discolor TaxID=1912936 RepID=A0A9P7EQ32_9AGAM|nr:uncharacterized protein F5147DRAFT_749117 [Suillus discolor]KAG2081537.1 hypothetical protein F5147DRAFT_749117 [Suillus discolor]
MYHHNIIRVNYTTYNVYRTQDVINPCTSHCNIMVLHPNNDMEPQDHRFSYGKVLGIYHVNSLEVGYLVDFLDPADILRGCHVIPSFASCREYPDGLGVSVSARDKDDWRKYYINR